MTTWFALKGLLVDQFTEWRSLSLSDLHFDRATDAWLGLAALFGVSIIVLAARAVIGRQPARHRVVLPAVPASLPRQSRRALLSLPLVLALVGLPFLVLAFADPHTALISHEVSYPGRRICIAIDASGSMITPFTAKTLNTHAPTEAAFFTTVAAAERFIQLRMNGHYRDLVSLVEFGNEAYVVTPFTSDYESLLLNTSLIADPIEFDRFPNPQTLIAKAIEQAVELFKAFKFLDASGNLLVIFSDGEDTIAASEGRPLDSILQNAVDANVPVYFVRMNYGLAKGEHIPDELWIPAVERTGGQFFAASDEASLLAAIAEIDRVSIGTIRVKKYTRQEPRFTMFALLACLCWTGAAISKLTIPFFQKFP